MRGREISPPFNAHREFTKFYPREHVHIRNDADIGRGLRIHAFLGAPKSQKIIKFTTIAENQ